VKNPQARRLFNPEVLTKHHAQTEWHFFKHRANRSRKVSREEPFGLLIVKQIVTCAPTPDSHPLIMARK
jgi:hypothetical protein